MMPSDGPLVDATRKPGDRDNWHLTVDFDGMTWGDIKALADYISGCPNDEPVEFETYTDSDDNTYPVGIRVPGWVL